VAFGGREQRLSLVPAQLPELRIVTRDQALAGIIRTVELEEVAFIEQPELHHLGFDQRADGGAREGHIED
jgi:hypothetical protein